MVETTSSLIQKAQVFDQQPTMNLSEACSIENGILRIHDEEKPAILSAFEELNSTVAFFIPASGSGSRMFDELYRFMESSIHTDGSKKFFDAFKSLAIYKSLSDEKKSEIDQMSEVEITRFLLSPTGLNLLRRPKGLIPFHSKGEEILNAFQEHVLQIAEIFPNRPIAHFTLQDGFQHHVRQSISEITEKTGMDVSFSIQNRNTDAFCFDENRNMVADDGIPLRRPAGHGSLLVNLNDIDADVVLIKNIDNIQHISKSDASNETWKLLMGTLEKFQSELTNLQKNYSQEEFSKLNDTYKFIAPSEELNEELLEKIVSRPTRICGMVLNEGAPGGGPFWIEKSGELTKQIVEKVQISDAADQQVILTGSSHFNPVMIVASKNDLAGNRLNLHDFSHDEQYLVVKKPYDGKTIYYRELPGLWNGGMYYWNSIFVEIPSRVFSPVKTVLDLTADQHLEW
ncbi:MAG: DUF4301 family protein [Crocinitomicaceae bacterium]|nr:DUF4301 family protein [Crocinitomicaceae bacterium]